MKNIVRSVVILGPFLFCSFDGAVAQGLDWPTFGQNTANTASNSSEASISANNVVRLQPNARLRRGEDVTARAAVMNQIAYFPGPGRGSLRLGTG